MAVSQSTFGFTLLNDHHEISSSMGFGSSSLSIDVNEQIKLNPTNTGFYFITMGLDNLYFQSKFPIRDPEDSIQSRVDSKIQDYQITFNIYQNWKSALYYQDYKGYYAEDSNLPRVFKQPDLHFNHQGVQVYYLTNEKHSSFLLQDSFWNDQEDSHSWVFNAGLDRFVINGDLLPAELKENKNQVLNQVSFNLFTL